MKWRIEEYLKAMSQITSSSQLGDYYNVLRHKGRYYDEEQEIIAKKDLKRVIVKQCFGNSLLAVITYPEKYSYVEGFYLSHEIGIPMEHGWCFNKQTNQVADFTTTKFGIHTDERFGVEISREILNEFIASEYSSHITPLQYCHRMKIGIFKE